MATRFASCSCGQLSAQVTGEPARISICHCLACQRRTGGPFSEQARFARENVAIAGSSTQYVRKGDEGTCATFISVRAAASRSITRPTHSPIT